MTRTAQDAYSPVPLLTPLLAVLAVFAGIAAALQILYTGDFSRVPDRHLMGAETPPVSPDGLPCWA